MDVSKDLAKVRLFAGFAPDELDALAAVATRRSVEDGHRFLSAGQRNNSLFVVLSGGARVERLGSDSRHDLVTLRGGDVFGEMSFLDAGLTTADVTAVGPTVVLELKRGDYDPLGATRPMLDARLWRNLALGLRDRLSHANRMIDDYADVEQLLRENPAFRETYGQF